MTGGNPILSDLLRDAATRLKEAGVPDGMTDARLLARATLGLSREDLLREPHLEISASQAAAFLDSIRRRCGREPVSRILGRREFRSLEFRLGTDTLDPRPDSETIVDAAIDYAKRVDGTVNILDLGTGTGCLLLAVLNELPTARGVGVDVAAGAVEIAARNAEALGLSGRAAFILSDWTDGLDGTFDIVISNPPYIETDKIPSLMPEVVRHDPARALDGGDTGLDAYREIAMRLGTVLAPGGIAVLEIGSTQQDSVTQIFAAAGYRPLEIRYDLGGHARGLVFTAARE